MLNLFKDVLTRPVTFLPPYERRPAHTAFLTVLQASQPAAHMPHVARYTVPSMLLVETMDMIRRLLTLNLLAPTTVGSY